MARPQAPEKPAEENDMTTRQPTWKLLANLGDVNPIDYGGVFVYEDSTGVYDPEIEILESPEDGDCWMVHRFSLEKCTFVDGVLSENRYHPEIEAWFAGDIGAVAKFVGVEGSDLIKNLCGDDILVRAESYKALVDYHGISNFDQYPMVFADRAEVEARYAKRDVCGNCGASAPVGKDEAGTALCERRITE
jgi:hypothetical protein